MEKIYEKESSGFDGASTFYKVYKINENTNLTNFIFDKDIRKESSITITIESMYIPTQYMPNFDKEYSLYYKTIDLKSLYMIYEMDSKKLYLLEKDF